MRTRFTEHRNVMAHSMTWEQFLSYVQWEANFYESCLRDNRNVRSYKLRRSGPGHNGTPTDIYCTITLQHPIGGIPPYTNEDRADLSPHAQSGNA